MKHSNISKFLIELIVTFILCIALLGVIIYKDKASTEYKELVNNFNQCSTELNYANQYIDNNIKNRFNISKIAYPVPSNYTPYVTSTQGLRESIKNVDSGGSSTVSTYHNAIDFACPEGTSVYAVNNGYVIEVYPGFYNGRKFKGHSTYGGLVVIKHEDGTTSLYAHLSKTNVKEGTYVTKSQLIGESGGIKGKRASGMSTGPHLHFAMYVDITNLFEGVVND